jgi:Asp-tRNA(Asn)/Glu-tRNA(Gln) amidotransferase A subunit family amidase
MKRVLITSSIMVLTLLPPMQAAESTATFKIEEATIDGIQSAILKGELTSTQVVEMYLKRIKAYDGACVNQPDGALGSFTTITHAGQINSLITLNLRPATLSARGFNARKGRSLTDSADNNPAMPDALEVAAKQDAHFKATGTLVGPLHGITFAIKDWYDTFDMRTTAGADAAYANDRPPRDAEFITRMRAAGAIILAKANVGSGISRSPFGGVSCNPYDTERSAGTSSSGSGTSVGANLVTCAIAEETGGSILHPTKNNAVVGLAPTQELVSRDGLYGAGYNTRTGPICRTVKDAAKVLDVIAGYDPKDELTVFSVGRPALDAVCEFRRRDASRRRAHRRDSRVHGPFALQRGRRRKPRRHRTRHRRPAEARRDHHRSGTEWLVAAEIYRQVRAVGARQAVHRSLPRGVFPSMRAASPPPTTLPRSWRCISTRRARRAG